MKTIIRISVIIIALYIAWQLFKFALHFLWFPLIIFGIVGLLIYLAMNQRR
jgi:uncharacterized membrane protein